MKTSEKLKTLSKEMNELKNSKIPTDDYAAVQKQITDTMYKLSALNEKMEKWIQLGKDTKSNAFKSMQYDVAQLENTLEYLKGEKKELESSGGAFIDPTTTEKYQQLAGTINATKNEMSILGAKASELVAKSRENNKEAKKLPGIVKQAQSSFKKLGEAIGNARTKLKKLHSGTRQANKGFSNLARTMKQMILSMAVFQIMFKGIEFLKSGLQNLAVYSKEYNKTMSELMSSTSQLKNAFAVAFAPILNVVIPYLVKLIDWISAAANAVSRFFAILGGKSTYTKAIKQNKDYAESLDKVGSSADDAKGSLAGFDDLNVLQNNSSSGSGNSSSGADGSGFEEEEIGSISDWTQSFKDAIANGDWYGVGALLAEKLNGALGSIDWGFIQEKARTISESFANGLNGFIANTDWNLVGQTIGNGLNTALTAAHTFFTTFDFRELGSSISEVVNGFFSSVDWSLAAQTISEGIRGIFSTVNTFLKNTDWESIGNDVAEFIKNIDWLGIFKDIGNLIWNAITAVYEFICGLLDGLGFENVADGIRTAFEDLTKFLNDVFSGDWESAWKDVKKVFSDVWNNILLGAKYIWELIKSVISAGAKFIWNSIKEKLENIQLTWKLAWESVKSKCSEIWFGIKNGISDCISNIRTGIANTLNNIKQEWVNSWNNMKNAVVDIFSGIWSSIKGIINSILSGIESMVNGVINGLNSMIRALNKLSFDIPDWVPEIGGKTFGFDIATIGSVSIPRLANGGTTTGSTLANIGEAGREAVLPLERDTGWADILADKLSERLPEYSRPTQITMELDGKAFARGELPYFNAETARIGVSFT